MKPLKGIFAIFFFFFGFPIIGLTWSYLCSLIPLPFPYGFIIWIGVPLVLLWIGYTPRSDDSIYEPDEDAGGL